MELEICNETVPDFETAKIELDKKKQLEASRKAANKIRTDRAKQQKLEKLAKKELAKRGVSVVGVIGYEPEIFEAGLEGRPVRRDRIETDVESILNQLL